MRETVTEWLEVGAGLLFPAHCEGCGAAWRGSILPARSPWLCDTCGLSIRTVGTPRCEACSHPFDGAMDSFLCPNCRGRQFHFEHAVAVMRNGEIVREIIHRFKYQRAVHLAPLLGEWLREVLADPRIAEYDPDCLVPVPLHRSRQRERGYNQARLLADQLGKSAGLPVRELLVRVRRTETQTHFDRKQRMRNLRDAFGLFQNADVADLQILLVDDVLTTGSTLDECARVLLEGGAASVRAVTVVRG